MVYYRQLRRRSAPRVAPAERQQVKRHGYMIGIEIGMSRPAVNGAARVSVAGYAYAREEFSTIGRSSVCHA